jgi:hypothetical protein
VIVVERLLPERARSGVNTEVYLIDLEMLALTPGGRERTEDEFRQLFAGAGLALSASRAHGVTVLGARGPSRLDT